MAKIQVGHPAYGSGSNVLKVHNSVNQAVLDLIGRGHVRKDALDGIRKAVNGGGAMISKRGLGLSVTEIYFRD